MFHPHRFASAALRRVARAALCVATGLAAMGYLVGPAMAQDSQDGLSGEVNVNGSMATGNTDRTQFGGEAKARYVAGRLEDNYRLLFEFADDNGVTTAQRILGNIESRYDMRDNLFLFGFVQYDDDRFSGFKYEFETAFGAGYRLIESADMRLLIQAGPGYRYSKLSGVGTGNNDQILVRGSAEFEYDISDSARFTNDFSVTWDSDRTKLANVMALTNDLFGNLATRLSFDVRHNTDPPIGTKKTDTLTKVALVYGF